MPRLFYYSRTGDALVSTYEMFKSKLIRIDEDALPQTSRERTRKMSTDMAAAYTAGATRAVFTTDDVINATSGRDDSSCRLGGAPSAATAAMLGAITESSSSALVAPEELMAPSDAPALAAPDEPDVTAPAGPPADPPPSPPWAPSAAPRAPSAAPVENDAKVLRRRASEAEREQRERRASDPFFSGLEDAPPAASRAKSFTTRLPSFKSKKREDQVAAMDDAADVMIAAQWDAIVRELYMSDLISKDELVHMSFDKQVRPCLVKDYRVLPTRRCDGL